MRACPPAWPGAQDSCLFSSLISSPIVLSGHPGLLRVQSTLSPLWSLPFAVCLKHCSSPHSPVNPASALSEWPCYSFSLFLSGLTRSGALVLGSSSSCPHPTPSTVLGTYWVLGNYLLDRIKVTPFSAHSIVVCGFLYFCCFD